MKHQKEPENNCTDCGNHMPYQTLPGARCPHCLAAATQQKNAQRLAGQMPPKRFSV